ncbi:hypothetical protein Acsp04_01850 [Actinomadura sp. NBRC 104425]|uniref:hypothetical protein n=1 Tax=Actinomadura sp. NBRC 104425 TaxID=3032204 RepID=UPI0024A1F405|nr:hypothetical protein [Actinomadura sp. NBRC 104425]GLZ09950.1 hypothetical protein Acsp04_01850 [Actinomadura sp. NBRC 104425]
MRAVALGAVVMAATLVVLMIGVVVISFFPAETLLSEGFFWGYTVAGGLVLALGAAVGGALAAGRARPLLGPVGPLAVVSLVAVPSLFGEDWVAGIFYLVATLVGSVAGAFGSARFGTRGGRP